MTSTTLLKLTTFGVLISGLLISLPSDACSFADPCSSLQAEEELGLGTVEALLPSTDEDAPAFLSQEAKLVFDGNGTLIAFDVGDQTFRVVFE